MFTLKISKRSANVWRATIFTDSAAFLWSLTKELAKASLRAEIIFRPEAECPENFKVQGGTFKVNIQNNLTHADVEFIDQQVMLFNLQVQRRLDKMALQRDWFSEFLPAALCING